MVTDTIFEHYGFTKELFTREGSTSGLARSWGWGPETGV